jgi:hypothetical protein
MNQRWRNRRSLYRVPDEVIRTREYEIVMMPTEGEVRELIATHHYLRTLPPSRFRFALYRGENLVGAAVFTHPTNDIQHFRMRCNRRHRAWASDSPRRGSGERRKLVRWRVPSETEAPRLGWHC